MTNRRDAVDYVGPHLGAPTATFCDWFDFVLSPSVGSPSVRILASGTAGL